MEDFQKMNVNASTLADLKAELARKQDEFKKDKLQATASYMKSRSLPKKTTVWSKKNAGVLERAQRDLEDKKEEEDELEKSRKALAAKAKLYEKMTSSKAIPEDEENEMFLVDFQKKAVDAILEERDRKRVEMMRQEEEEKKRQEDADRRLMEEIIPEPEDHDEQWVDYVDSFGRSRRCLKKDLAHLKKMDEKLAGERKVESKLPDLMSSDMYREKLRQKWEEEETEAMNKPAGPVHYANVQHDEIRTHGVGFYQFNKDEEERQSQLENLKTLREQTLDQRQKKNKLKEKRKAIMAERLAKVKQRKMVREGKAVTEGEVETNDDDMLGPKLSEKAEQELEAEPLLRDDSWRQDAPVRDWDKGKKVVDFPGSRFERPDPRDERLEEFAPPGMYYEEPSKPQPAKPNKTKGKKKWLTQKEYSYQGNDNKIQDIVEQNLKELRSDVDSVNIKNVSEIPLPPSSKSEDLSQVPLNPQDTQASIDTPTIQYGYNGGYVQAPHTEPYNINYVPGTIYVPPEFNPSLPPPSFAAPTSFVPVVTNSCNPEYNPSALDKTLVTPDKSNEIVKKPSINERLLKVANSNVETSEDKNDIKTDKNPDLSAQVLKGAVHYSSKPVKYDVPQLPRTKVERVDLKTIPLNLPAPPVVGFTPLYPSQEEVLFTTKKVQNVEKQWSKQFESKMKPDKIPFESPYVQKEKTAEDEFDKIKFDPTLPPPGVKKDNN